MTEITGQLARDIIDYLRVSGDETHITSDMVTSMREDTRDFGLCDTCEYIVSGVFVEYISSEGDHREGFYSLSMADCLDWVASGKPILEYDWLDEEYSEAFDGTVVAELYPDADWLTFSRCPGDLLNLNAGNIELGGDDNFYILLDERSEHYGILLDVVSSLLGDKEQQEWDRIGEY